MVCGAIILAMALAPAWVEAASQSNQVKVLAAISTIYYFLVGLIPLSAIALEQTIVYEERVQTILHTLFVTSFIVVLNCM